MSLSDGRCPGCGETLLLDSSKEKANCIYCGKELIIEAALQKCKVDDIATFDSLLLAAQQAVDLEKDYDLGLKKYKEALALAPNDYRVLWGIFLCEMKTINWYMHTKGFVQVPGDAAMQIKNVIAKYADKALVYAPVGVKPYYINQINEAKGIMSASVTTIPHRPKIRAKVVAIAFLCFVVPAIAYVGYTLFKQMMWDDKYSDV